MIRVRLAPVLWAALVLILAVPAFPQASIRGEVYGTILDSSGAAVADVKVRLTNLTTNITRETTTGTDGTYVFPLVDPGFYSLVVEAPGFQTAVVERFQVTTQATVPVEIKLKVGQREDRVTVRAEAEAFETRGASVSALITSTELQEIPLNAKQFVNLMRLETGVVPGTINTGSSGGRDFGDGGYVHGKRFFDNTATIDGAAFWDPWAPLETISTLLAGPGVSHDAIAEFRLFGNNPPPTEGFTYGGRINVTTKSGGNELHGAAYYYMRNDALDARSYFDGEKPPLKRHLFGGSIGGPIRRDRTFFFGNYEGMRQRRREARVPTVPTPALIAALPAGPSNGFLSEIFEAVYPVPVPGTFAPGDLVAPFRTTADQGIDYNLFLIRIDHRKGEKDNFTFRYIFDQAEGAFGSVFSTGVPSTDLGAANRWQQQIINWTRAISPKKINEFRFNYHREFNNFPTRDTPEQLVQCCGFSPSMLDPTALPTILAVGTGLSPVGSFPGAPQFRAVNFFQINDTFSLISGRHSLKFGADVMSQGVNDVFPQDIRPFVVFIGFGSPFDSSPNGLTTGTFLSLSNTFPVNPPTLLRGLRRRQFALYGQDTWQVTTHLNVDLGLRYELVGLPYEVDGYLNNLYAADGSGNPIPEAPITDINNVVLQPAGSCNGCLDLHHRGSGNWAPRIGIAWMPFGQENTVLRAGFGIQYGEMFFNLLSFNRGNPPFSRGVLLVDQQFGTDFLSGPAITPPLYVYDPALERPYYLEWNAGIQRLLTREIVLHVQYVGNRGKRLFRPFTPNFGLGFTATRPNLAFGRIVQWRSAANSWYDSLQVELSKRFAGGLSFQLSYTWSKSLDEASGEVFAFSDNNFLSHPSNPKVDKGPSDFDMPHVLVGTFVYDLPFGRGKDMSGLAAAILGGWQISGITTYHSGQRLTFFSGMDNNGDGNNNDRARVLDPSFTLLNNRAGLPDTQYFNPAAVGTELTQSSGAIIGRNTHRGPSFANVDFAVKKRFRLTERVNLDFRTEFFNILNHTNFDQPISVVSSPVFGEVMATRNPGRQLQMLLRLSF